MTRGAKLTLAGGITLMVLLAYGGIVSLAKGAVDFTQNLSVPPEAMLSLAEVPSDFVVRNDLQKNLGIEAFSIRYFDLPPGRWKQGPFQITHHVIRMVVPTNEQVDVFLNSYGTTAQIAGKGSYTVERVEGPSLGPQTAWRRFVDASEDRLADVLLVAVQQGAWFSMLSVKAYRDELNVDEVAKLARPMVTRLEAVAKH